MPQIAKREVRVGETVTVFSRIGGQGDIETFPGVVAYSSPNVGITILNHPGLVLDPITVFEPMLPSDRKHLGGKWAELINPTPFSSHRRPTPEDLDRRFTYHAPKADQPKIYEKIRAGCRDLAQLIVSLTPVCAEQTRAINAVEEAMFLANAAVARHDHPSERVKE